MFVNKVKLLRLREIATLVPEVLFFERRSREPAIFERRSNNEAQRVSRASYSFYAVYSVSIIRERTSGARVGNSRHKQLHYTPEQLQAVLLFVLFSCVTMILLHCCGIYKLEY